MSADDKKDPEKLLDGFLAYFKPEQNVYQSWYTLGSLYSGQFKSQGDFYNKLQQVAHECSFTNPDEVVKFLFLTHNQDKHVHEDLLKQMKETTTLSDMIHIAKTTEGMIHSETLSTQYLETVKSTKTIEAVKCDKSNNKSKLRSQSSHQHPTDSCGNCGYKHPPRKCKAYKKECFKCGKEGHFSSMCCSRPKSTNRHSNTNWQQGKLKPQQHQSCRSIHEVDDHPEYQFDCDSLDIISVRHNSVSQNTMFDEIPGMYHILTDLHVSFLHSTCTTKVRFKVDSGACANLLPFKVLKLIEPSVTINALCSTIDHNVHLFSYSKHNIKQLGIHYLKVSSRNKTKVIPFFIVDSRFNPIVGLCDSVALNLIKVNTPMYNTWSSNNPVSTIAAVGTNQNHNTMANDQISEKLTKQRIINSPKYKHLFQDIGKFKINPVSITLQKDVRPVQKPPQKVPLAMQKAQFYGTARYHI